MPPSAPARARREWARRAPFPILVPALLVLAPGCVTERTDIDPLRATGSGSALAEGASSAKAVTPSKPFGDLQRVRDTHSMRVVAEGRPLGTVPYDRMSLPLVHPDATFVATQVGIAPPWDTILARPAARPPTATRVEVYALPEARNAAPRPHVAVEVPALLGRSCDRNGFLVEAPRPDGSRHLGYAAWTSAAVTWLVADEHVNAFASLGPDGALAWSRRARSARGWDLVVRVDGAEWSLPGEDGDWLFPTWSGRGNGLFVARLHAGAMDIVFFDASSRDAMFRTLQRVSVAGSNADDGTAHDMLGATVSIADLPAPERDTLAFYHPSRFGAALWTPPGDPVVYPSDTMVAVIDPDNPQFTLVAGERSLQRRRADGVERAYATVVSGIQVPRRTANPERPWILLSPGTDRLELTMMRLLPVDTVLE